MENNTEVVSLYLDDIIPNRFQPREVFNEQSLKELAVSIKEHGVIQPIIVRKVEDKYEIIAGERRYKASTMAGLTKIPAIIKNLDDKESSKLALIENLQRKDLTPIEEARTYQKILELEDGAMTQEQLAATMGKTQSSVSNKLRLLVLPDEIQDALLKEKISERHARCLLNIEDKNLQIKLLDKIIADRLTVRDLEKEIRDLKEGNVDNGGGSIGVSLDTSVSNTDSSNSSVVGEQKAASFGNGSWTLQDNNADLKPDDKSTPSAFNMFSSSSIGSEEKPTTPTFNFASFGGESTPTTPAVKTFETFNLGGASKPEDTKNLFSANTDQKTSDFSFVPSFELDIPVNKEEAVKKDDSKVEIEVLSDIPEPASKVSPSLGRSDKSIEQLEKIGTSTEVKSFDELFNLDFDIKDSKSNDNNVASSINTSSITVASKRNVKDAVQDIKNTIKMLELSGYKVEMQEQDGSLDYKITITLKKDA